ncbi:DNA methyltransferase [Pelagibacterium lentulum]|uniref:DNA methyltransferase n=2 Tax=Pelagibacterium lentulum TaxID=2029865 RepID=A0A916RAU3_9HYPH|nr:DNA methyltransferase [Pelagibacterium lentulum]
MRRNPTEAERKMWLLLKDRRFDGYKFRRQVPIGRYIADFVCHSARLVVELDGSQHHGADTDRMRDDWFEAKGFATLRIWNNDLSESPESVSDAVWAKLQEKQHG